MRDTPANSEIVDSNFEDSGAGDQESPKSPRAPSASTGRRNTLRSVLNFAVGAIRRHSSLSIPGIGELGRGGKQSPLAGVRFVDALKMHPFSREPLPQWPPQPGFDAALVESSCSLEGQVIEDETEINTDLSEQPHNSTQAEEERHAGATLVTPSCGVTIYVDGTLSEASLSGVTSENPVSNKEAGVCCFLNTT